jgi:competence protein ComEC
VSKKIFLYSAAILLLLNFFAWKEVFSLCGPQLLKVDFLDVGQGDSIFIETPQKHQILIDGGPTSVVLQKLSERIPFWDKTIDLIILTHPESDHMQGLFSVLQRYNIDYVLWTGVEKTAPEYEKWISVLEQKQNINTNFLASIFFGQTATKVSSASAGTKIKAGNAEIDVLYPLENLEGQKLKASANDTCVVAKLIYGKDSFLFTGDISSGTEKELANSYELASLKADVLKVAHHGSKYSTSDLFLENIKPEIAVISVGKNSYGHPTPEVLQRLEKYDIQTLRTDQSGDINMVSDGNNINIINN